MKHRNIAILVLVVSLVMSGCGSGQVLGSTLKPTLTPTPSSPAYIKGVIVDTNGKPAKRNIYIIHLMLSTTPTPDSTQGNNVSEPKIVFGENGTFLISNIDPGEYILMFATNETAAGVNISAKVDPGEVLDLGNIVVK